jgi:hypothetical protein
MKVKWPGFILSGRIVEAVGIANRVAPAEKANPARSPGSTLAA